MQSIVSVKKKNAHHTQKKTKTKVYDIQFMTTTYTQKYYTEKFRAFFFNLMVSQTILRERLRENGRKATTFSINFIVLLHCEKVSFLFCHDTSIRGKSNNIQLVAWCILSLLLFWWNVVALIFFSFPFNVRFSGRLR